MQGASERWGFIYSFCFYLFSERPFVPLFFVEQECSPLARRLDVPREKGKNQEVRGEGPSHKKKGWGKARLFLCLKRVPRAHALFETSSLSLFTSGPSGGGRSPSSRSGASRSVVPSPTPTRGREREQTLRWRCLVSFFS